MEADIKVRRVKCKCGKSRMHCCVEADGKVSKEGQREINKLVKLGLDVDTITLDEARNSELCFKCKL